MRNRFSLIYRNHGKIKSLALFYDSGTCRFFFNFRDYLLSFKGSKRYFTQNYVTRWKEIQAEYRLVAECAIYLQNCIWFYRDSLNTGEQCLAEIPEGPNWLVVFILMYQVHLAPYYTLLKFILYTAKFIPRSFQDLR